MELQFGQKGKYRKMIQKFVRALKALPFLTKGHIAIAWKNCLINEACDLLMLITSIEGHKTRDNLGELIFHLPLCLK